MLIEKQDLGHWHLCDVWDMKKPQAGKFSIVLFYVIRLQAKICLQEDQREEAGTDAPGISCGLFCWDMEVIWWVWGFEWDFLCKKPPTSMLILVWSTENIHEFFQGLKIFYLYFSSISMFSLTGTVYEVKKSIYSLLKGTQWAQAHPCVHVCEGACRLLCWRTWPAGCYARGSLPLTVYLSIFLGD